MKSEKVVHQIDLGDVDKASSTWSGFLYQGKVAIYTVLKYINHYYPDENAINNFQIEIEYLEDFSIIKNGEPYSLHQVKAKPNTKTIGSYNEANINLLGKLEKYPSIQEVNLHTATEINSFTKENFYQGISGYNTDNKKKVLQDYKMRILEDDKFDELYSKLKISCGDGLVPLERAIDLSEIENKILEEIELFYSQCTDETIKELHNTLENKNFIFANLIYLVEEKVQLDHEKKLVEEKILIDFEYILDILHNKNVFQISKDSAGVIFLNLLTEDFNDYCKDYGIDDNHSFHGIWNVHFHELKSFEPKDFFALCLKLTPNKYIKEKNVLEIENYRQLMQPGGVCDSFIHSLNSLSTKIQQPKDLDTAYKIRKGKEVYSLSTINKKGSVAHLTLGTEIYRNLTESEEMFKMLFEVSAYINADVTGEYTGDITNIDVDKNYSDIEDSEKMQPQTITSPKTIKFIKIDDAKESLTL